MLIPRPAALVVEATPGIHRNDVTSLIRLHTKGREESLQWQLVNHPAVNAGLFVAASVIEHHPAAALWRPAKSRDRYRLATCQHS